MKLRRHADYCAYNIALGRVVARLRVQHGLAMRQIAEPIGISTPSICRVEEGDRMPSAYVFVKLAEVFGMSLDEFNTEVISEQGHKKRRRREDP